MRTLFTKIAVFLAIFGMIPNVALAESPNKSYLIKGEGFDAVYFYGTDGKRHPFPNKSVYESWYGDSFDSVLVVTDTELANIPLGKNVTYRPGAVMIKITTVPMTYAVDGNIIRPIASEEIAESLYGSDWNTMIRDVPDVFFTNYQLGDAIDSVNDFDAVETIRKYLTLDDMFSTQVASVVNIVNKPEEEVIEDTVSEEQYETSVPLPACEIKTTFYPDLHADPLMESAYAWYSTSSNDYVFNVPVNASGTFGALEFRTNVSDEAGVTPLDNQWEHGSSIRVQKVSRFIYTDTVGTENYIYTCSNAKGSNYSNVTINIVSN